jgi:CelD/BcsL family acetyltransferase involved in cellulose biosynthesis
MPAPLAVRIRRIGSAERGLWTDVARRCAYATYFHTPGWAELMAATAPGAGIATQAFELDDGALAVLPLIGFPVRGIFRACESMVPGVYGGPVAERALRADEVEAILDLAVTPTTSRLRVFGNPYLEPFAATPDDADDFTHVLDLRPGFEAVFRGFHSNHRWSYRAAARSGLTVERAATLDEYREYFRIYQLDRRRWGANAKTDDAAELFEEIHRRADPDVALWLARQGERVAAGGLWLRWNDRNVHWHGAADPELFRLHATNYLITEIIRDSCARGVAWCDLNPSAGLAGVVAFKDAFGAERRHFRHARRAGAPLHALARGIERTLRRCLDGARAALR